MLKLNNATMKKSQNTIMKYEQELIETKNYLISQINNADPKLSLKELATQVIAYKNNEYLKLKKQHKDLVNISEELKTKEPTNDKLLQEINSLKEKNEKLVKNYKDLKEKNHHNYVLIGEMKKIIKEKGNLQGEEKKLGGIPLTERAFEKKEEEISTLQKENETNKRRIEQMKQNLIKRTSNQSKCQNS